MMHRSAGRLVCFLLTAVCLLSFTGCERMLNRQFYALSPHMELTYQEETDSVEITNYAMLLKYLQEWVRAGVSEGTMRFSNFDGNVEQSVDNALGEMVYNDAYGRFVEAYLVPLTSTDIKGTLVSFKILYRGNRPQSEIDALLPVSGSGLRVELEKALRNYASYAALELLYPVRDDFDALSLMEELYFQQPLYALGFPQISSVIYRGDKGARAILELRMTYGASAQTLMNQKVLVERKVLELVGQADITLSPKELALQLYEILDEFVEYDFDRAAEDSLRGSDRATRPYTMAGAMLDNKAVGEGYALAYKALCDAVRIPCQVVTGRLAGDIHAWNAIQLEGHWYWVDAAAADRENLPHPERFLGTDALWKDSRYIWDAERYPRCETDPALLDAPEPPPAEESAIPSPLP